MPINLKNKSSKERAKIKGREIAKIGSIVRTQRADCEIEITEITVRDNGVELLARAWENGEQIGFGKDGTVDIERFNIYNPPILVPDLRGHIIHNWVDEIDGTSHTRRLREDPKEALLQSLEHTIKVKQQKFGDEDIIPGKVGNTTSTFYPDAHVETSSVDGYVFDSGTGYITIHDSTTADDATDDGTSQTVRHSDIGGGDFEILRTIFVWDTSSIGSDTIDSGTASFYPSANGSTADSESMSLVASAPASPTTLVVGDYDSLGTTKFGADIALGSWTTGAYEDFTLNASGLAAVDGNDVTEMGLRTDADVSATEPSGANTGGVYFAEQTGTTNDPKLVIEHSAAPASTTPTSTLALLGVG